uniref:Uncharacterized protein n=1 Tax=Arundo donax TaxID=35708 RepID=A0A0A9C110_ARUDO
MISNAQDGLEQKIPQEKELSKEEQEEVQTMSVAEIV